MHDLILGTAGHIDHGKTTLIRALTGTDTDRLPEEKRRGITIELGFAELVLGELRLGVVDVPGHERFVRQMLAGATGMDMVMLVVAADDSVNRQTREHLDILRMLEVPGGVIAISKCDLVEPGWVELVEEEIRELVAGTFLAEAPIIATSAATGEGLDTLKAALQEIGQRVLAIRADTSGPFRMAIDRSFTMAGHGTVVTGSVTRGKAALGDELVIEPGGVNVRVRGLRNHGREVEEVHRGQRAAINLVGIHHDAIRRGHELASPGHLVPSRRLTVSLQLLRAAPRPLKNRARVRLHIGTAEVLASVRLVQGDVLEPGASGLAQLYLSEAVVSTWNQPFVIRSESPVETIGGGRVLDPDAPRLRRPDAPTIAQLERLHSKDPIERAGASLYLAGLGGWEPASLPRSIDVTAIEEVVAALRDRGELVEVPLSPTRIHRVHREVLKKLAERVEQTLAKLHERHPLRSAIDVAMLERRLPFVPSPALLERALAILADAGKVRRRAGGVALVGHAPKLSQKETQLLEWVCRRYREAGLAVPKVSELAKEAPFQAKSLPQLLAIAVADGTLIRLDEELYLHETTWETVRATLAQRMADGQGHTLSEIREWLGTTRKYAVPLCEWLDKQGITRREGDLRYWTGEIEQALESERAS